MNITSYLWLPILIPFIVGLFKYKYFNAQYKYLYYFVAFGTCNEITYFVLVKLDFRNTLFLSHLYYVVAFVLLGFYYREVFKGFIKRAIIHYIMAIFVLFSVSNVLFFQSIFEYPALPSSIHNIVYLFASIVCFYRIMVEAKIKNLWEEPLIWINTAILIYYAGNLINVALFNFVLEYSIEFSKLIVNYFVVLNALFYTLVSIGFWKTKKQFMSQLQ